MTLLFTDLSGSSTLAGLLEYEILAALLDRVHDVVNDAVVRHGGRVVRTQGDGSLAVFGYPRPGEHDARHACQAALEAHAAVAALPPLNLPGGQQRLALHSGVHSGLVYVAPGNGTRGDLDVVGDAANTASRLASCAGRGGLLADADSLGPELAFFDTDSLTDLALPGRAIPIRAAQVKAVAALKRRIDAERSRGQSPLLGREDTLSRLVDGCTRSDTVHRVIAIRGQAGIGKTRLLDELASRLNQLGVRTLRGGCESFGITPVLAPFRQLLGADADSRKSATEDDVRDAALQWLRACDDGRHVMLLDDWQWADDACRALLDEALRTTVQLRVVLASRHAGDVETYPDGPTVCPMPLRREETLRLVQAWAPGTSPFVADELHEHAGGVPLLVEELCHMLRHRGELGWKQLRAAGARGGASHWMKSMMAARLESLAEPAVRVVQAAAVAGLRAPLNLLTDLLGHAPTPDSLKQLADADLLYTSDDGAARFRHGLSRDAVYELIPLDRREDLHRRAAEHLEGNPGGSLRPLERMEALAHHARAAGDWALATLRCEAAADAAVPLGAYDSARRQYLASIECAEFAGLVDTGSTRRWCTLVHRLAMTCMFDPLASPEALVLAGRAVATARTLDDAELLARSLYWEAYLLYVYGHPKKATRRSYEAATLAAALDNGRLLAQVQATYGQALAAICRYEPALEAMHHALRAKQTNARHSGALAIGSAFTLACRASVLADQGDFVAAHASLDEARTLVAAQPNHPVADSVRNWEMVILAWEARWADVRGVVAATAESAQRLHALLPLAIARAVDGYARWRLERDDMAIVQTEEAVRWMENHHVLFFTSIYYAWLAEMAADTGRDADAWRWTACVLRRSRAGERLGEAVAWRAMARVSARQGDQLRAWRRLGHAERAAARRRSIREAALNVSLRAELQQGR
ncbi:AAA family ATPase [Ideonella sp. 4Y16]|uniref:ATP-binding protein n=1 Tax=Ideonella alba TaxID=2824118 RepID=UPI001B37DAB9|nr:adenylate/guanylate cyclase domain-containing protein [Ideonella alba]MBQ0945575.1 AAA family ATPase [Ideonella alba]